MDVKAIRGEDRISGQAVATGYRNLTLPILVEHIIHRKEGRIGFGGSVLVTTGKHKGRAPDDKYVVSSARAKSRVWWENNKPMSEEVFDRLEQRFAKHLATRQVYVQDLCAGPAGSSQLRARYINSLAWHSLFIRQLLRHPSECEKQCFIPELTVVNCPELELNPHEFELRSPTIIAIHLDRRLILMAGTAYGGENKKALFTFLNYSLVQKSVLPMHCAANHAVDNGDDTALFFGLSGTGKTTLSADPGRILIGDDEHGWSDEGVFNIEGGCYAKTYKLDPAIEPDIFETTEMFGTVIENMTYDAGSHKVNFQDASLTENTRCAYAIDRIPYASATGAAGHAKNIFMLTCDVFGVLPPIARLTPAQAMYHFLSGFTSRVAGTESGTDGFAPVFSSCFGQPFLPCFPEDYGRLLRQRITEHGTACWLVNTGWTGGPYGVGRRIPITITRKLLTSALEGHLDKVPYRVDRHFGLAVPMQVPGVPDSFLNPRLTWEDPLQFDDRSSRVATLFEENFTQYRDRVDTDILDAEIRPHREGSSMQFALF